MLRSVLSVFLVLISVIVLLIIDSDGMFITDITNEEDYVEMYDESEFKDMSSNTVAREKVMEHFHDIEKKVCSVPVAKLFPVESFYPMGKRFRPHCVELHRCDNDAGCCKNESMRCSVVESEAVHLYVSSGTKIFLLSFKNDTRCGCQLNLPMK